MIDSSLFYSIIIPTFNCSCSIERCISSILDQKFDELEILIIDNKSEDSTLSILKEINDPRINIYVNKDQGPYDAMNFGINLARGKWLFFLGSDDYFFNNSVLKLFKNYLIKSKFSVVYGNVLLNGNSGWAKDGEIYAGKFSKNRMLVKSICHQSIFYRRDFLISNNLFFDLRYPVSADWHLNLRCRRLTRFKYVDLIVAVFTAGGISTIKRDSFPDQIKTEFADMYPSATEIFIKETVKKFLRWFK